MVFLPDGGEGCTCAFALAGRNLPFGGRDLLVHGQPGKRLVEEPGADDYGRAVSVFCQVDRPVLDFILDIGIFVPKVGNRANAGCDHDGFLSARCEYYITILSEAGCADAQLARPEATLTEPDARAMLVSPGAIDYALFEPGLGKVDHFMAAVVEFLARRLARGRLVERKEEHAPGGAEALLLARRVPTRAEALGRQHDQPAARAGDGVAAGLFKRAHEGRDTDSSGADARGRFDEGVPFGRAFGGRTVALEGHENRQIQERAVAVGEPAAAEELDGRDLLKEAGVRAAQGGARRVFADVAAKGGELALFLDNPIVPGGVEDRAERGRFAALAARWRGRATRKTRCAAPTCMVWASRAIGRGGKGFACRGVGRDNLPIGIAQGLGELADENPQRDAVGNRANLEEKVKMIGHDHERRNLFAAAPLQMKAPNGRRERAGDRVFDGAIGPNFGKRSQPLETLQGDHVEIRRLVVEASETAHRPHPFAISSQTTRVVYDKAAEFARRRRAKR